jgi:hypothetical protein
MERGYDGKREVVVFPLIGRAVGACLSSSGIHTGLHHGQEKSDQAGFHPILSLFSCLLIYERHERPNYATPIFLTVECKGRLPEPAKDLQPRKAFFREGKGRNRPQNKKKPIAGIGAGFCRCFFISFRG